MKIYVTPLSQDNQTTFDDKEKEIKEDLTYSYVSNPHWVSA